VRCRFGLGIGIVCWLILICATPLWAAKKLPGPAEMLFSYLTSPLADPNVGESKARLEALQLVHQAQVITLHYEKRVTGDNATAEQEGMVALRDTIKASHREVSFRTIDGKVRPKLFVIFSKLFSDIQPVEPIRWLSEMYRPIGAGYDLLSVEMVMVPAPAIERESFIICQQIVQKVISEISHIQPIPPQLQSFTAKNITPGAWPAAGNPSYPAIDFESGIGAIPPTGPLAPAQDAPEWCRIKLQFTRINGDPRYPLFLRAYPRQGFKVNWHADSADKALNAKLLITLLIALAPLEDYEAHLGGVAADTYYYAQDSRFPGVDTNLRGLLPKEWQITQVDYTTRPFGMAQAPAAQSGLGINLVGLLGARGPQGEYLSEAITLWIMPKTYMPTEQLMKKTPASTTRFIGSTPAGYRIYAIVWSKAPSWPAWEQQLRTYFGLPSGRK
jgi:hypothetical protein